MIERLLNSLWKGIKVTVIGTISSALVMLLPALKGLIPEPAAEIDSLEKVGLAALIGGVTGLLEALRRFLLWRSSRPT